MEKNLTNEHQAKDCPFCTASNIEDRVITSNEHAKAFPTNIPIVPGHTLIVPIRHVSAFGDLTPEETQAIFQLREKLEEALVKAFNAEGFNYAWNDGEVAGQSVAHFHLHMLPRKKGDTGITRYEPREFLYRPGSREVSPDEELNAVSNLIKESLENE